MIFLIFLFYFFEILENFELLDLCTLNFRNSCTLKVGVSYPSDLTC